MTNGREDLHNAAYWLGYMNEDLSFNLSAEEGLKLWRYAQAHRELAEFCDQVNGDDADWTAKHFKEAIGRNPFSRKRAA